MKRSLLRFPNVLSLFVCALFSTTVAIAQTNPTPQSMPYTQNFSAYTGSTTTYLAGWQGWTIAGSTSTIAFPTAAPAANQAQAAGTNASTGGGNYDFNGKIGFLNTANALKSICLSISTTGYTSVQISYLAATQRTQSIDRVGAIGLQYRIGTTGTFMDVGNAYQNINTVSNLTGTGSINPSTITVNLPASCDNLSEVQLRWVYKDVSGTGGRPSFSIDDVSVTGTVYTPPVLTYTTSPSPFSMFGRCSSVFCKKLKSIYRTLKMVKDLSCMSIPVEYILCLLQIHHQSRNSDDPLYPKRLCIPNAIAPLKGYRMTQVNSQ